MITDPISKEALKETEARILVVAAVHKRLYTSDNARFVDLQEYLSSVLVSPTIVQELVGKYLAGAGVLIAVNCSSVLKRVISKL